MSKKRTFEGTKKGEAFTVTTALTDSEAIAALRDMAPDGAGFASDCADQIEIAASLDNLPPHIRKKIKVRSNLIAWGFRMAEERLNRVTVKVHQKIMSKVAFRRPFSVNTPEGSAQVAMCGPNSKYAGKLRVSNGLKYFDGGHQFYGFVEPDGKWSPTKVTPEAVVKALTAGK